MTNLFKGICLFLKIFVVTLLRITKKEGHRALRAPQTFIMRLASTPKSQGKDNENRIYGTLLDGIMCHFYSLS